jgi:16S rRNA (adenine(1408)-N(1))-methyltransferase
VPVPLRVARGRRVEHVEPGWLADLVARHATVSLDVGAGDGRFALRRAAEHPDELVLAMDASHAGFREASSRAARSPQRGGLDNVAFVVAALDAAPDELRGLARQVTVHFPWGTLLDAAIGRDEAGAARLASLVAAGGRLRLLVSAHDRDGRQGAVSLEPPAIVDAYARLGFEAIEVRLATPDDVAAAHSSWGKRLMSAGGGRDVWLIELRNVESAGG